MEVGGRENVRFGDFEFDLRSGKLFREGRPVKIQPQPLRVLAVLLESAGETVSRESLRSRVWGDATFVEFDQGLNYCIRQIRLALRDGASKPLYIETLPKQGYRFIARVEVSGEVPQPAGASRAGVEPAVAKRESIGAATSDPSRTLSRPTGATSVRIAPGPWCPRCSGVGGVAVYSSLGPQPNGVKYTQLTDFTDSALAPALSPDGRMVAFIRGGSSFLTGDQIYVKVLPNGEARRLTDDTRQKYNLAFTPDGTQIAYTVLQYHTWATYTVSVLGGDSHLFLGNAAGLTWLDQHQLLFSRVHSGQHMGIVTGTATGQEFRDLYFPSHQRAMAHYSWASPDHRSALVVEMDENGKLGALPADFPRRPVRRQVDWTARPLHLCRLVTGRITNVLHGFGGRDQPPVAPALSRWKAGANHVRPDRSGRCGGRAGWLHHHFDGSASKRHLDPRQQRRAVLVIGGRNRENPLAALFWR